MRAVVLMSVVVPLGCGTVAAQPDGEAAGAGKAAELRAVDPLLSKRLAALEARSPTWRAALDTLRATGFEVLVARPEQVGERIPRLSGYRATHLGEVIPLRKAGGVLRGAVVTVDVARLEKLADRVGLPRSVLEEDVDRILIHELYGHVVPLAVARRISGGCPDPAPGEPVLSSCAITRENRIRRELGLELRTAYDLRGLAIGRSLRRGAGRSGLAGRPAPRDP